MKKSTPSEFVMNRGGGKMGEVGEEKEASWGSFLISVRKA